MGKEIKAITFARTREWVVEEKDVEGPVTRGLRRLYPPTIVETRVVLRVERTTKVYKNKGVQERQRRIDAREERELLNISRCVNFEDRVCLCPFKADVVRGVNLRCKHYVNWLKSRKGVI